MNSTGTQTTTYTVADIRKVVNNFAADFSMLSQATGLWSRESVAQTISDLKIFAEYGYLVSVTLSLEDKDRNKLRVVVYKVADSAVGWTSERPGNNLWPRTPDGSLFVLGTLSDAWWQKTDAAKETFIKDKGFYSSWSKTDRVISLAGLNANLGQKYASNGYGWERTNYS